MTVITEEPSQVRSQAAHEPDIDSELVQADTQPADPRRTLTMFIDRVTFAFEKRVPLDSIESTAVILPRIGFDRSEKDMSVIYGKVPNDQFESEIRYYPPEVVLAKLHYFGTTGEIDDLTRVIISQAFRRMMLSEDREDKVIFYFDVTTSALEVNEPLYHLLSFQGDQTINKELLEVSQYEDEHKQLVVVTLDREKFYAKAQEDENKIYPRFLLTAPFENNPRLGTQAGFSDLPMNDETFLRDYFYFTLGLTRQLEQFSHALEKRTIIVPAVVFNDLIMEVNHYLGMDLWNWLMRVDGFQKVLNTIEHSDEDKERHQSIVENSTRVKNRIAKLLIDILHINAFKTVFQNVNIRTEMERLAVLLSDIHNQNLNDTTPLRRFALTIDDDVPMLVRSVPNIMPALFFLLVNKAAVEHYAEYIHMRMSKVDGAIQISMTGDMKLDEKNRTPTEGLLTNNIKLLLLIFSGIYKIPVSTISSSDNLTSISITLPAISKDN